MIVSTSIFKKLINTKRKSAAQSQWNYNTLMKRYKYMPIKIYWNKINFLIIYLSINQTRFPR